MRSNLFLPQTLGVLMISFGIILNCAGQKPMQKTAHGKLTNNIAPNDLQKDIIETEREENASNKFNSEREDLVEAANLSLNYKAHALHKRTIDSAGHEHFLDSFAFKASDLMKIVDFNTGDGITPDKVVLTFGQDQLPVSRKISQWHMIAYGMSDGKLLEDEGPIIDVIPFEKDPKNPIDKELAERLHSTHLRGKFHLKTVTKCHDEIPLQGFSFESWQIREIIKLNRKQNADTVVFKMGLEPVTDGNGNVENDVARWHIVAYGMFKGELVDIDDLNEEIKLKGELAKGRKKENEMKLLTPKHSVFDKADPCPPCK